MAPQIICGTATFGMDQTAFQDKASVTSLLSILKEAGVNRLDTAARYPPLNPGRSEELIGESASESAIFLVDTKVATDIRTDGSGDLTAAAIQKSVQSSLSRLQKASKQVAINVLHIHRADPSTPIAEQVRAFNEQIQQGTCRAWGLSNVPVAMCREIFRICDAENLRKPMCYQGEYNIMTRGAEAELLPLLREHGVNFNAFRPLAAGFLTAKFIKGNHEGTRFGDDNPLGKPVQKLFSSETLRAAMTRFDATITQQGISSIEAAVRWIFHHSALAEQDGVILGASKEQQIRGTVGMVRKGLLPPEVLQAAEELWGAVKESRAGII